MLGLYIVSGIIGLGLILVSIFTGHGDHSGGDAHHGDNDGHDGDVWLPFFSIRFWTYTLGTFGLTGALLTLLTDQKPTPVLVASAFTGILLGLLVSGLMRSVQKFDTASLYKPSTLTGKTGILLVATRPGQDGKVRIQLPDESVDITARGYDGETIEANQTVVVVAMDRDIALVMSQRELMEETSISQNNA
jgi:membrane protein implicated in regulation of membrane protease activity